MFKRIMAIVVAWAVVLFMLTACSNSSTTVTAVSEQATSATVSTDTAASAVTAVAVSSIADASAENDQNHDDAADYSWDAANAVQIVLNGDAITVDGPGVEVKGNKATITSAGTYTISGTLSDGQIIVDTKDSAIVRLILNGVDIHSATSAPIYVANAEKTMIVLADNTANVISDSATYTFADPADDEPNAAIFSKDDLTIYGSGSLTVTGNYNDGIASKDGLIIASGTITVNAVDDGIRGKNYLVVKDGVITVSAEGDGLKADEDEDSTKGYISIAAGTFNITAGADAIQATTDILITDGAFTLSAGGGASTASGTSGPGSNMDTTDESPSARGIVADVNVIIDGGTFNISTADDAFHSNASLTINGGTFSIASGDDGMHADNTLNINGGNIKITQSYEGIEGSVVTVNAGEISIVSSDDGLNIAGGNDSSGMSGGPGGPGGPPSPDSFATSSSNFLYINGGSILIDTTGDGIDVNGSITMTDGVVIVNGPTENMNGALDCDGTFTVNGGFLLAAGSSGMAESPDANSSQNAVLINTDTAQQAGTLVHIQSSDGGEILTFAPTKQYQSIVLSSPELTSGSTYTVSYGGSATGTASNGLYQDATYTPGTEYTNFTITDTVTKIGNTAGPGFH